VRNADIDFTCDKLTSIVSKYIILKEQYYSQQEETVEKILKAISTYHPVIDRCSYLAARLDVLCAFA
jgi:DNA mismatch repair ATPase MutS